MDAFYLSFCFTLGLATLVFSVYFPFILSRFIQSWLSFLCPPFYDRLFPVAPLDASAVSILFALPLFTLISGYRFAPSFCPLLQHSDVRCEPV